MARTDIRLNHGQMARLLKSDQLRPGLRAVAEKAAARARASAPVESGEYRAGIRVVSDTTDRAVERVVATAPHSALIESQTGNLKRALGR
jgi:hypothetical protein